MRTIVVGASSGLGRCIATHLGQRGDQVAMFARRHDQLVAAATEAGPSAIPIVCDVTDEARCRAAVGEAVEAMGGLDALVYASGIGVLRRIIDTDAALWNQTLGTNVVGASLITAAATPHLEATGGRAVYLSSVQGTMTPPWAGLAAYAVSKAALGMLVDAWRGEHPKVGFTRINVGECGGGEGASQSGFALDWDADLAGEVAATWVARHYMTGELMEVDELLRVVDTVLALGASAAIPSLTVMPRYQN